MKKFLIIIEILSLVVLAFCRQSYAEDLPYILTKVNLADIEKISSLGLDVVRVQNNWVEFVTNPNQLAQIKSRGVSTQVLIEDMEKYLTHAHMDLHKDFVFSCPADSV